MPMQSLDIFLDDWTCFFDSIVNLNSENVNTKALLARKFADLTLQYVIRNLRLHPIF